MTDDAAVMLSEDIRTYAPEKVTLPWVKSDGELVTFRLLLSRGPGLAMPRKMVNDRWKAALKRAGLSCDRYRTGDVLSPDARRHRSRPQGDRAVLHTAPDGGPEGVRCS